jgi:hypothetical protein
MDCRVKPGNDGSVFVAAEVLQRTVKNGAALRPGHAAGRPVADMTNIASTKPFVYDRLSFPGYYLNRPCLDTEWLLSTLFDASLLSTSKAAGNGGSFFAPSRHSGARAFARTRNLEVIASCLTSGFRVRPRKCASAPE